MNPQKSNQLYRKLFTIYSAMIMAIVVILMIFFVGITRARVLETNLDYLKMMQEKSLAYLEECARRTDRVQEELHQSQDILKDLLAYFQYEDEAYQNYRLDRYMETSSTDYKGFDSYADSTLRSDSNMCRIDFVSYEKALQTSCYPEGKVYQKSLEEPDLEKITKGELTGNGEFGFLKEIRNPDTLESAGCVIIYYSVEPLKEYNAYYQKPELLVVNQNQTVVAVSPESEGKPELSEKADIAKLEALAGYYVEKGTVKDYTVYGFLEKKPAGKLNNSLIFMIVAIGAGVTLAGEFLVYCYLKKLAGRLDYILEGMQRVTVGDLEVRLATAEKGDELDLISVNFNQMCEKLNRYIQKSYLAEIEQKNAEIEILQNQINPHFLYNTLEAIRMKAICNKDREVAKMLYSMAVIFRSQLKEADVITLVQELHYCKKYLELFEYRYQDKFTFQINCPEEYMDTPVIKFIVQPILENYFAHGIYGEREGNEICIFTEKQKKMLLIHVTDNGRGMEETEILQMNRLLQENTETSRKSIGLMNVNRRLKAVYGPEYGVELKAGSAGGMHVILKVGTGEEYGTKKGNADRG